MSTESILNFVQAAPDVGTSGQPKPDEFALIADDGYEAVINLAMPDGEGGVAEEGSIVSGLGMRYVHLPVDFADPTVDDLRTFIGMMGVLAGKRVWVHCAVNARVSAFMYHYLTKVRGHDDESSRSFIFDHWELDDTWSRFMALTADDLGDLA